jgi:lysozyme
MEHLNAVVDLSHHNRILDFNAVKADGIVGIIHKATQGFRFRDEKLASRRQKCREMDIMWGSYHFGVGGDGIEQADFFLEVVQPLASELIVLDFEPNPNGLTMTLNQAEDFVETIHHLTGRWPGLYGGNHLKEVLGRETDTSLANCWLWFARYGPPPQIPPAWQDWTFWQYTDGMHGSEPHQVNGIGHCDRDKFNGDLAALKKFWGGV